ncbi:unannotated protein [freshwater metagenome]|uniref:Unannotated protein n=1 Tax=freshwater metagenome TaxID=449393 RepID=A0A6J7K120_9ZZZZ
MVDARQLAAGDVEVAPRSGATSQHNCVELGPDLDGGDINPDVDIAAKFGSLRSHLIKTTIEMLLLHLELGDSITKQTARAIGTLEHNNVMPSAGELLGGSESGRTGSDHRNLSSGANGGKFGGDPTFGPRSIDDLNLDLLDRDRVGIDPEHTCSLARSWTEAAGELGEVVRGVKSIDGFMPMITVDEVVPVRDEITERASVVAEGDTTVHTTTRLLTYLCDREVCVDLFPIHQADGNLTTGREFTTVLQETTAVTHDLLL